MEIDDADRFEEGAKFWILVHKGSYSEISESTATISFFLQKRGKDDPKYQFTLNELSIPKGEKLYLFAGCGSTLCELKLLKERYGGEKLLPLPEGLIVRSVKSIK